MTTNRRLLEHIRCYGVRTVHKCVRLNGKEFRERLTLHKEETASGVSEKREKCRYPLEFSIPFSMQCICICFCFCICICICAEARPAGASSTITSVPHTPYFTLRTQDTREARGSARAARTPVSSDGTLGVPLSMDSQHLRWPERC